MPFGKKPDANGRVIEFDAVYEKIMKLAVARVGFEIIRGVSNALSEKRSGAIHSALAAGLNFRHVRLRTSAHD